MSSDQENSDALPSILQRDEKIFSWDAVSQQGRGEMGLELCPLKAHVQLVCVLEEVQLHNQTIHEGSALMKQSILGERLFVLFRLAENLSAQFQSLYTLGSNVD